MASSMARSDADVVAGLTPMKAVEVVGLLMDILTGGKYRRLCANNLVRNLVRPISFGILKCKGNRSNC